jgi:hypothetical protein
MRGVSLKAVVVVLAATALAITLGACGSSSTGPSPTEAPAAFFDSIYAAYQSEGTAIDSIAAEFIALELELPAAYDAQPTPLAAKALGGNAAWRGLMMEFVYSNGDSEVDLMAFDDNHLTHVINVSQFFPHVEFPASASGILVDFGPSGLIRSTNAGSASATVSVAGLSGPCTLQHGLHADPFLAQFLAGSFGGSFTCTSAAFNVSATLVFSSIANLGFLQSWSIGQTTIRGPRFVAVGPSPLQSNLRQNLRRGWIGGRRQ